MLGKLSQDPNQGNNVLIRTQLELEKILNNASYEITDLNLINEELVNVKIKHRHGFETFSRKTNVLLGSMVTAFARIYMHKNIQKVQEAGQFLLYSDTDSMIIARQRTQQLNIPLDPVCFGKFKLEEKSGSIKYFYSLG